MTIWIDDKRCTGCARCLPTCAYGGVEIVNGGFVEIDSNDIFGGRSTGTSTGVALNTVNNAVVLNNRIHGGTDPILLVQCIPDPFQSQ